MVVNLVYIMYFMHQSFFTGFATGLSLRSPELIILIMIVFATLLSFFHLGSPQHSYNSLNNLQGSWISREILALSMFGFGMLLFLISRSMDWPISLSRFFMIFSMISGILLILAMSGIYMIKTVPSWNTFFTPLSFIGSTFLLGSVGMVIFMMLSGNMSLNQKFLSQILIFMLIVMAVLIMAGGFHQYHLSQLKFTGIEQTIFNKGAFFFLFIIRMVLLFATMIGLSYLLKVNTQIDMHIANIQTWFILISLLILIEEIMGRYLFYISYFRVGV